MPKFSKGHKSRKKSGFVFKSRSGQLIILSYQLVKYQDNSSNTFRDILLTRLKCPNFLKGNNSKTFFRFFSKGNQVIYLSSHSSMSSIKAIAYTFFFRNPAYKVTMPKFSKVITPEKIQEGFQKLIRSFTHHFLSACEV